MKRRYLAAEIYVEEPPFDRHGMQLANEHRDHYVRLTEPEAVELLRWLEKKYGEGKR